MKKIILFFVFSTFLLMAISCSDRDEPKSYTHLFSGTWAGILHSDKFCSGTAGTWTLQIDNTGKISNGSVIISGKQLPISGVLTGDGSTSRSFNGYYKDGADYGMRATVYADGKLSGSWVLAGKQEENCWKGNRQ